MNELKLYNGVKHININVRNKTILNIVKGIPGCGKTTFILKNFKRGDLVVFPTREGAENFRLRYRNLHPDCSKDTANDSFRTLHSFIINSTKHIKNGNKYNRLIIDEALMVLAGEVLFAAELAHVPETTLIGDENQIPYIN